MMKPWWEETWELSAEDPESGPVIGLKDGGVLFDCNDATRARGAHAAPDMVRALLLHVRRCDGCGGSGQAVMRTATYDVRGDCPLCKYDRAALTKAGVPIP